VSSGDDISEQSGITDNSNELSDSDKGIGKMKKEEDSFSISEDENEK
jgi:hypothetical protein